MLGGMRRDCGGKEENQGNYSSEVKGDARFHEQLHQKGVPTGRLVINCLLKVVTSTSLPKVTVHTT